MNFSLNNVKPVQIAIKRDQVTTKENTLFFFPVYRKKKVYSHSLMLFIVNGLSENTGSLQVIIDC